MLEKSWAKTFADKVFPAIDENIFSVLYSKKASRPNTPVNVIVGALILKEALNVTDDEIVEAMAFDIRYQYALHTTSFEEQPISDRTLSRFRARVLSYETEHDVDLIHECVVKTAKEISDFMNMTPDKQRMDSLMVAANIRNLSLLELFYTCVSNLCKIMNERGTKIPDEQHHYIEKDDYNKCIYHKRNMDATERTIVVMKDADILIKICDSTGDFDDTSEYQLLIRLLKERTIIDDDGSFLVVDGAYSGEKNSRLASEHNLKLVTTNFTGRKPDEIYADFVFTEDGKYLIKCKNDCNPEECSYDPGNDRSVAYFQRSNCEECPYRERCQPRFLKTRVRKEVSWKSVGRAKQLQYMQTEEFSEYAKFRNGVEAIPSLLRRRYHVDKIPVHGKKRT
ncbi:MAG: transposase [Anaerostipes sp.]